MRTWYLLYAIALLATSAACKKDNNHTPQPDFSSVEPINFEYLSAGQRSQYVLLRGEDIRDPDNYTFEYVADTLVLQIVTEDENGWLVKEHLTAGSVSLNGENNVAFADSTWYYYLKIENNALHVVNMDERYNSRIFFFQHDDNQGLTLSNIANPEVTINGWKPTHDFEKSYLPAMTKNYRQLDEEYNHLNVIINNLPMEDNAPGHTHIFSAAHGLVRSTQYSAITGAGFGWDLIGR